MIGVVLAFYFRKEGPKQTITKVSDENSFNEWKYGEDYWKTEEQILGEEKEFNSHEYIDIIYEYKPKKEENKNSN
jgi:hypothetical protein